jgi:hypothetical protein
VETRPYFVIGDLLATTAVGALAGLVTALLIPVGWNMMVAMLVGMALGMIVSLPGSFAFMPFFGAMEIMVPTMLAGMFAGMWIAMAAAMNPMSAGDGAGYGAAIGVGCFFVTYALNAWFRRGHRAPSAPEGAN